MIMTNGSHLCFYLQVCGKAGHMAGFIGAKYLDCPNKPVCWFGPLPLTVILSGPHLLASSSKSK